jgi:hypothetical protein
MDAEYYDISNRGNTKELTSAQTEQLLQAIQSLEISGNSAKCQRCGRDISKTVTLLKKSITLHYH